MKLGAIGADVPQVGMALQTSSRPPVRDDAGERELREGAGPRPLECVVGSRGVRKFGLGLTRFR